MATDKKINYEMQGKVRNYLGKQKMVKAPLHWQSGPKHPSTELAYITKKEKDLILKKDLHGSLKNGPNVGPSGIMSLNDAGTGRAGSDISAGMDKSASDKGWASTGTKSYSTAKSPAELGLLAGRTGSTTTMPESHYGRTYKAPSRWGGIGGLLRGALGIFGGIPGKLLSGLMTAKNWAKNKATGIGDEVEEFGNYPTLDRYFNRNTDKYKDKPYLGQGKSNYSFDGPTVGNDLGLAVNRQEPVIGPGLRVGEDQGYYGMGSRYDPNRFQNTNITGGTNVNDFQGVNFNKNTAAGMDASAVNYLSKKGINAEYMNQGGRIGYNRGRVVNPGGYQGDEFEDENTLDFMQDQGVPYSEMAEASPFEIRIQELMDEGMSWQEAYQIASEEFGQVVGAEGEGESDQGIASLV